MSTSTRDAARAVLEAHWRDPGFTCPNAATYPWLWLWDSCFHAIVWAALGEGERACSELSLALGAQDADGFVPHVQYLDGSHEHDAFWGRPATSSITQPPVHAHAVVELARRGVEVPDEVVERSVAGLRFLLERRRRSPSGLVELVHPWESGCDHSPRWDDLMGVRFDEAVWFRRKGELLRGIRRSAAGAPLANDDFPVGSVAFSAIVAHGARELGGWCGDGALVAAAAELADALASRWEPGRRTFVDDGPTATGSGRVRTSEALLLLVVDDPEIRRDAAAELHDPDALGGDFGPAQVHRDEPTHSPGSYWRGPSWPQLDYLLWVALGPLAGARLAATSAEGAVRSGFAEYWDPDTAAPGGAVPQSWSTLAVLMEGSEKGSNDTKSV
jgi:hypothetical protein